MSVPVQAEVEMPEARIREVDAHDVSGWAMLGVAVLLVVAAVVIGIVGGSGPWVLLVVVLVLAAIVLARGLVAVSPGQAQVVQLLGRYRGTVRTEGLRWVNPLTSRRGISTRIRNHESDTTKVNDLDGNPIDPEIAQVMLMRQQAGAVVAARGRIVEGAVGMVESALARLEERGTVELDEERKATMVSNLLVVLAGDRSAQPVVNAGSLYQ